MVFWVTGFETMLFQAGAISFFSRLTQRRGLVILGAVAFRTLVMSFQLYDGGVVDAFPVFLIGTAATSALACLLYIRAGLPAAMLFSAVVSLHVFAPAWTLGE